MRNEKGSKPLGHYVVLQRGKTYHSKLKGQPGPYLLGLASIARNGGFRTDKLVTYGGDSPKDLLVYPGQLIASLKDVTQSADLLGAVARIPNEIGVGRLTQDTVKLIFKSSDAPVNYVYWVLRSPQYREYCRAHATGTTNLGLPRQDFLSFIIPPLSPGRRLVVDMLEASSDKIELNRRMNRTLEGMAAAIFKSWFIDFDPVIDKALAAGNPIPDALQDQATRRQTLGPNRKPLPQEIANLFPDSFEDSELGPIPAGWKMESLDEIAEYLNGLACQKHPPVENQKSLPVIKIRELRQGITNNSDRASADVPLKYVVEDGDILFSWSGSLLVSIWCGGRGVLNQHVFKVTSENFPKWYFYQATKHHLDEFQRIASDKATTMGHIKRHHLSDAKMAVPSENLLTKGNEILGTLLDRRINAMQQARTLANLRDTLLPKLLSGEIDESVLEQIEVT